MIAEGIAKGIIRKIIIPLVNSQTNDVIEELHSKLVPVQLLVNSDFDVISD